MPIARVTQGKDAYPCLNYVLTKDQAEFLETNCATDQSAMLAREFDLPFQPHRSNGAKKHVTNHVAHFSIGFHAPQSGDTLIEVAHRFMDLMGFDPVLNQYVLACHHDTDDCHVHLVLNRIRLDGDVVSDSFQKRRAEVAMRTIEAEFGFPPLKCSWEVDIKAPTVAEVRQSRKSGEPIPRQAVQAILEQTVPGCRTLEALQAALQAEGVALLMTPILSESPPRQSKRKGKGKGKETPTEEGMSSETGSEAVSNVPLETRHETASETAIRTGAVEPDKVQPGATTLSDRGMAKGIEQPPNPQTNPSRYQLVYQWTAPSGKVETFSTSALGKRYTQRGLQDRWGVGLQGRNWVEWAVQQSVKSLLADQLTGESVVSEALKLPVVDKEPERGAVVEEGKAQTQAETQAEDLTGVLHPLTDEPNPDTHRPLTPSQQVAREYYQDLWLKLEEAYTQSTGQTRDTDPSFDVHVLGLAQSRWALDQCIAMLATTSQGQVYAQQGRTAFTAYVQGLFDQLPAVKREAEKPEQER